MSHYLSIIIPVLNEAPILEDSLRRLRRHFTGEIIVVDGGSSDGTLELLSPLDVQVVRSLPGRGRQMNLGARHACGDDFLFLHADTRLRSGFASPIQDCLRQPGTIAGAFRFRIDGQRRSYRLLESVTNWRSTALQCPYGDQGLFVNRAHFEQIGGFPELPLLEDYEMVRRLRRQGRIETLEVEATTSDRRWRRLGVFRTTALNWWIILAYWLGVSPERLALQYRGQQSGVDEESSRVTDHSGSSRTRET